MNLIQIAVNNLRRRKAKMVILFLGLLIGVATVIAVYSVVTAMNHEIQDRIDEFGANAMILPASEGVEISYGDTTMGDVVFEMSSLDEEDMALIRTIPEGGNINIISPKLIEAVEVEGETALLVGLETTKEFSMKPWFEIKEQTGKAPGERLDDLALLTLPEDGVILGSNAARYFEKEAGDSITINENRFTVFAILEESGTEEDGLIMMDLKTTQSLLGRPGELSMIELSAYCRFCPIEEIVEQIQDVLPHTRPLALRQAALIREETIGRFSAFGFALSGVVLLIGALVVLTTMLNSVKERTREIGIFRALGFRKSHIISIIFLEASLVGLAGGLAGFGAGIGLAKAAGPFLAQMQVNIIIDGRLALASILLSVILAIVGSAYPALKAAKLDPAESLRFI